LKIIKLIKLYLLASQAMGHWGTCTPLDFKLFNFSGHFRAAKTLDNGLHVVAYPVKQYTGL